MRVMRILTYTSIVMLVISVVLCGTTFARWVSSYEAIAEFDVKFTKLCSADSTNEFDIKLEFFNDSDTTAVLEGVGVLLDWENRLIASTSWNPGYFVIEPGEQRVVTIEGDTTLPQNAYSMSEECITEDDNWSVRLELYLSHPIRRDSFTLRRLRELGN